MIKNARKTTVGTIISGHEVQAYAQLFLEDRINSLVKSINSCVKLNAECNELVNMLHEYVVEYVAIKNGRTQFTNKTVCKCCGKHHEHLNEYYMCNECEKDFMFCDSCGRYEHKDNAYQIRCEVGEYYTLCHDCHFEALHKTVVMVDGEYIDSVWLEYQKQLEEECGF